MAPMRKTLWITLLTLALALGAFSSGARGAALPMQGECCETLCRDMPICANMLMCHACTAPTAHLAQHPVLTFAHKEPFPLSGNDHAPTGPVAKIWNPPD